MSADLVCQSVQADRTVTSDGSVEGDSGGDPCELLYGICTTVSFAFPEDRRERLQGKTCLLYDDCVIAYVGGGISGWNGWISIIVRGMDGRYHPESGISSLASFPVPSEEMAFGGIMHPGRSLYRLDFIRLRCLSAVSAGDGNPAALSQGNRSGGKEVGKKAGKIVRGKRDKMAEFLYNAWSGWTGYTDDGKLPVMLMAVLLFLWFGRKQKEQWALLVYASAMTVCCILPVTAALLMRYQTKFYNYEWIWSLVPVTAVTAFGLTVFWTEYRAENAGQWKKVLPVTLLMLSVLLLCGSLGKTVWNRQERKEERARAYLIAEQLSARYSGEVLCLWAPREIAEYVREKEAGISLLYGRNIWDGFLNAYSYDKYNEDTVMLEQWMENLSMTGAADMEVELPQEDTGTGKPEGTGLEAGHTGESEDRLPKEESGKSGLAEEPGQDSGQGISEPGKQVVTLEECVGKALEQGVNCIIITDTSSGETVARMEKALGTEAEVLEGYFLFVIQQGGSL